MQKIAYNDFVRVLYQSGGNMSAGLGKTEEGIVLVAAETWPNTEIPTKNKSEKCGSCGTAINAIYCGQCGQKNDDLRRSLWRLITETLGGIFSFESRIWRTWGDLITKPGKVANAYAGGARTRYSSPIRIYIVISFIFFGYLAISNTNLLSMGVSPSPAKAKERGIEYTKPARNAMRLTVNDVTFDLLIFQTQAEYDRISNVGFNEEVAKILQRETAASSNNQKNLVSGFINFLKQPEQFNNVFNTWLTRVMFFMVPIAMLLGAIFIRGPTALLYDHLIHAIYVHAVFFSSLLIAIFLTKILPGIFVLTLIFGAFIIYLPLSLKKMFGRGWFKTILTSLVVGISYTFILYVIMLFVAFYLFTASAS